MMLSDSNFAKEFKKPPDKRGIAIAPFKEGTIKKGIIRVTASQFAWQVSGLKDNEVPL